MQQAFTAIVGLVTAYSRSLSAQATRMATAHASSRFILLPNPSESRCINYCTSTNSVNDSANVPLYTLPSSCASTNLASGTTMHNCAATPLA